MREVQTKYGRTVAICAEQDEAASLAARDVAALSETELATMRHQHRERGEDEMEAIFMVKAILGGRVIS